MVDCNLNNILENIERNSDVAGIIKGGNTKNNYMKEIIASINTTGKITSILLCKILSRCTINHELSEVIDIKYFDKGFTLKERYKNYIALVSAFHNEINRILINISKEIEKTHSKLSYKIKAGVAGNNKDLPFWALKSNVAEHIVDIFISNMYTAKYSFEDIKSTSDDDICSISDELVKLSVSIISLKYIVDTYDEFFDVYSELFYYGDDGVKEGITYHILLAFRTLDIFDKRHAEYTLVVRNERSQKYINKWCEKYHNDKWYSRGLRNIQRTNNSIVYTLRFEQINSSKMVTRIKDLNRLEAINRYTNKDHLERTLFNVDTSKFNNRGVDSLVIKDVFEDANRIGLKLDKCMSVNIIAVDELIKNLSYIFEPYIIKEIDDNEESLNEFLKYESKVFDNNGIRTSKCIEEILECMYELVSSVNDTICDDRVHTNDQYYLQEFIHELVDMYITAYLRYSKYSTAEALNNAILSFKVRVMTEGSNIGNSRDFGCNKYNFKHIFTNDDVISDVLKVIRSSGEGYIEEVVKDGFNRKLKGLKEISNLYRKNKIRLL